MVLKSPAFKRDQPIPERYTCDGINISPPLSVEDIPINVDSLVITMDDKNAKVGNDNFVHWLVWNIKPDTKAIQEGSLPFAAVVGKNSFHKTEYSGPCPPKGEKHMYRTMLYGLNRPIEIMERSNKIQLMNAIQDYIVSTSMLTGTYSNNL